MNVYSCSLLGSLWGEGCLCLSLLCPPMRSLARSLSLSRSVSHIHAPLVGLYTLRACVPVHSMKTPISLSGTATRDSSPFHASWTTRERCRSGDLSLWTASARHAFLSYCTVLYSKRNSSSQPSSIVDVDHLQNHLPKLAQMRARPGAAWEDQSTTLLRS